ncbi:transposase domain-containing protein [Kitasatospora sp. NPDC101155]|uniref:transposase domain-containing protein n=1 Tax=Kitasatospora sp. NPDC101155 TaxID=3364097 RepID=UPI0037FF32EA
MQEKSAITRTIETAAGVHAPGHLGELTQIVDFALVDAVLEETGAREKRLRLLPSRVVVYFVLALALFEQCSYRAVWGKLTAALDVLAACFGPEDEGELPYARRLLSCLDASMLPLGDAAFDAVEFLREVTATGAQFLVRSSARRRPTIQRRLPDGSYLARLAAPYRAGSGYGVLPVRVIEAWITVTLADGATRREPWRLITSLLDHERHPARELVELYHRRWQVETTHFSIKATMLE